MLNNLQSFSESNNKPEKNFKSQSLNKFSNNSNQFLDISNENSNEFNKNNLSKKDRKVSRSNKNLDLGIENKGLYLISKPDEVDYNLLELLFASKNIAMFQLRLKNISFEKTLNEAKKCKSLCTQYNIPFIINDSVKIFQELDLDGVHLGLNEQDIINQDFVLNCKLNNKIIGVSCYNNLELAIKFANLGVSYVSFGAIFKTKTKVPPTRANQNIIKQYKSLGLKSLCCAIGGLNNKNLSQMVSYGLDYAAVVGSVWNCKTNSESLKIAKKIASKFKKSNKNTCKSY
jgi:thiamine-phosphate pyrophosphorylase